MLLAQGCDELMIFEVLSSSSGMYIYRVNPGVDSLLRQRSAEYTGNDGPRLGDWARD
jgi:hypothetical protein